MVSGFPELPMGDLTRSRCRVCRGDRVVDYVWDDESHFLPCLSCVVRGSMTFVIWDGPYLPRDKDDVEDDEQDAAGQDTPPGEAT